METSVVKIKDFLKMQLKIDQELLNKAMQYQRESSEKQFKKFISNLEDKKVK